MPFAPHSLPASALAKIACNSIFTSGPYDVGRGVQRSGDDRD